MIIRDASEADAPALVRLIAQLDHQADAAGVAERIAQLAALGLPQLVAEEDGEVVALCGLHRMGTIHRPSPVGRVTILVVDESMRGKGIGAALLAEAEARLRALGCAMIEITSNNRLADAHRFYRHMGFDQTSQRFAKPL